MNGQPATGLTLKKFIPGIAWFFFVTVLLCLPGSDLPTVGSWFDYIQFDKWVHVGLFAILSFLFMRPVIRSDWSRKEKWNHCVRIAIATSLYGIAGEVMQKYFVPGRSFDMVDWGADTLGAIVALVYCKLRFFKS